ncbi:uncharacterized protein LOC106668313 isoform X2 [Cimex lectularius]|uniref:SANTA domain-containing protein n=1 Tax=Cimex lectularius TaxID=79782 RepID=A0A8I6TFK2_CIMLE|nr:uncharacterized protein LOC106668313 isoform X2 [Cimex lectularius]
MNNLANTHEFKKLKRNIASSFLKPDYSKAENKKSLANKENAKSFLDCSRRTVLHDRTTKGQLHKPPRDRSKWHNNLPSLNKHDISMSTLVALDQCQSRKVRSQLYDQRSNPSQLNCSFVVNNLNPSVLDSFSVYPLQPKIHYRQHPIPPLNLERSQSGFLRPVNPTLEDVKLALMNEKKEELISTINYFKSSPNIDYVRKLYFFEKLEATLDRILQTHVMQTQSCQQNEWQMDPNKFQRIQTWMDKTQRETEQSYIEQSMPPSPPTQAIHTIPQETCNQSFQDMATEKSLSPIRQQAVVQKQGSYCLGDWTVIKGDVPYDLKVTGTLIHAIFRNTIEENHVSHNVIEVPNKNVIKTNVCTYMLIGKFVDPTNSIPQKIKKYFMHGGFPENWKSVARNWHSLSRNNKQNEMLKQNQLPAQCPNLSNTRSKFHKKQSENCNILNTPRNSGIRNSLNSSIVTRSISRREKMRRLGLFGKLAD